MLHQPVTAQPASDVELACGTRLLQGQYQIEQPLIAGGFGITYLARDSLDRRVVIKECFPGALCLREDGQVRPLGPAQLRTYNAVLRSFLREAHLLAQAEHPNIVPVHQVFRENGTAYIAMDFIDGLDLLSLREAQPARITPAMIQSCLVQALQALGALHDLGILHRDLSPDNLIWTASDQLVLIDFGAAIAARSEEQGSADEALAVKDGYSPHELYHRNAAARPASDLYALGATLVFLLTGEAPAYGPARLEAVTRGEADPLAAQLAQAGAKAPFWATVAKALSVLPGDRYQSAAEWLEALEGCAETPAAPTQAPMSAPRVNAPSGPVGAATQAEPQRKSRIAALVAEARGEITAGLPRVLRQDAAPARVDPGKDRKRQFVDMFGQPISDLQAWLAEQDNTRRVTADRTSAPAKSTGTPGTAEQTPPPAAAGRSALHRFFGKRMAARPAAPAS
ncbi:serine/threonine-protein kinase [Phaeobacter sp. HF9A]|uniref:serine/threonine protein kinase n=1 Tax=Phaeobacter sp. HF9A TaxID=2721561 RepID=UPI001430FC67|nr:serine/threonine-protein kinase [Phaeobacter sp. HF9A]NIZ14746.1 serine/threonine protein kinase [Phaeobacter sp. HF9A]